MGEKARRSAMEFLLFFIVVLIRLEQLGSCVIRLSHSHDSYDILLARCYIINLHVRDTLFLIKVCLYCQTCDKRPYKTRHSFGVADR